MVAVGSGGPSSLSKRARGWSSRERLEIFFDQAALRV
jgi:hypothetical protein